MILYRNRFIGKMITTAFNFIYQILAVFSLQPALFVILVQIILFFTGALDDPTVKLVSDVALIASIIYAVVGSIQRLLGLKKDVKKSKGAQIISQPQATGDSTQSGESDNQQADQPIAQNGSVQLGASPVQTSSVNTTNSLAPTYYKVKNRPGYVMAEFIDRYELYLSRGGKLIKIRTDFKSEQGDRNDRLF